MSDVFISYSRKDIAYARILHESLLASGFETWIDWQDIPPSVDWLNEVYTAIEQSDTFLFILSASSAASEICTLEIEHASENNKRLIPIVINEVNPSKVHPALATINWIFSRTKDEFQPAIATLITAIRTDYDWVKAHTRLQMRALEWKRANQDKSFLLRGADLSQAEEWFARSTDKTPEPSLLQIQYLQTSRKEAVKRQRNLLTGVGAALIVSAVLGVVAVINGQRASSNALSLSTQVVVAQNAEATAEQEASSRATQQAVAEEQRNIAVARQLAAQGLYEASNQYELALLLGLEAERRTEGAFWSRGNLLEIMQASPRLISILRHPDNESLGHVLAISPDGQTLAAAHGDVSIVLWDISNPRSPIQIGQPITGHDVYLNSLAFSPDGQILAGGGSKGSCILGECVGSILLWDVADPQAISQLGHPLPDHAEPVHSLAFSPDGRRLASGSQDHTILLWDISSPESPARIGPPLTGHTFSVDKLAFSPDGLMLASGSYDEPAVLWDISNPESPTQIGDPLSGRVSGVESLLFSADGQTLAAGHEDRIFTLLDVTQTDLTESLKYLQILPGNVDNLVFSPDLQTLASESILENKIVGKTILLWDISKPAVQEQLGQPLVGHIEYLSDMIFSPDGQILASCSWDGTVILWDLDHADLQKRIGRSLINSTNGVRSLAFSPDGTLLAAANGDDSIFVRQTSDLDSPVRIDQDKENPFVGGDALAISPDGRILAGSYRDTVILWDLSDPEAPAQLGQPLIGQPGRIMEVAFSPDGKILASSSTDDTIILWDVANPDSPAQVGQPLTAHTNYVPGLAFSPDGQILASGSWDNSIILWDVSQPNGPLPIGQPIDSGGSIHSLALSPDGRILASGSDVIKLWDVRDPERPVQIGQGLEGHSGYSVNDLAFSPDSQTLASGAEDQTIILWDVSDPNSPVELSHRLTGHKGEVYSLAFSPDGQTLASGGEDDTIILWNITEGAWRDEACRLAGRNLTPAEWKMYLPAGEPYRMTCPDLP